MKLSSRSSSSADAGSHRRATLVDRVARATRAARRRLRPRRRTPGRPRVRRPAGCVDEPDPQRPGLASRAPRRTGAAGGGATYGSPGRRARATASSIAGGVADRARDARARRSARTCCRRPAAPRRSAGGSASGRRGRRWLAGIRIEPPPSLACAIGTMPGGDRRRRAAARAAGRVLGVPGVAGRRRRRFGSVVGRIPSSGTFVLPIVDEAGVAEALRRGRCRPARGSRRP